MDSPLRVPEFAWIAFDVFDSLPFPATRVLARCTCSSATLPFVFHVSSSHTGAREEIPCTLARDPPRENAYIKIHRPGYAAPLLGALGHGGYVVDEAEGVPSRRRG